MGDICIKYLDEPIKFVKKGKVKEVYEAENHGKYLFKFTDQISVFDKIIPSLIPRKGESLLRCSAHWFRTASKLGIQHHYEKSMLPSMMVVKRAGAFPVKDGEPVYSWANNERTDYQLPLEVIARYYIAGSMFDRIQDGRVKPEDLGYPTGYDPKKIKMGEKLPQPLVEVTTKFEPTDRHLTDEEGCRIAGMRPEEYKEMVGIVLALDEEIARQVEPRGLLHFDGKKEFAFGPHRELMLIDTFGTGDEDRFVNKRAYEDRGEIIEISKEYVRQYYRKIGYHDELQKVRKQNKELKKSQKDTLPEPDIPALPQEQIDETSRLYLKLMEMVTGESA
jgi:phosphoribosylaminoimidazole-succinocarboxamide synthase